MCRKITDGCGDTQPPSSDYLLVACLINFFSAPVIVKRPHTPQKVSERNLRFMPPVERLNRRTHLVTDPGMRFTVTTICVAVPAQMDQVRDIMFPATRQKPPMMNLSSRANQAPLTHATGTLTNQFRMTLRHRASTFVTHGTSQKSCPNSDALPQCTQ